MEWIARNRNRLRRSGRNERSAIGVFSKRFRRFFSLKRFQNFAYGVELVNYEELFPNSAIYDDSRNPFEVSIGHQRPQVQEAPVVQDYITIYQQVQASLRSLGFHESSEGKKISDKVFKRRLKDKMTAYFRNS
jgi:hypothetical protein